MIERLTIEKTDRGLIPWNQPSGSRTRTPLRWRYRLLQDATPILAGTAHWPFNTPVLPLARARPNGRRALHTKHFEEMGEAVSLGTERAAVLTGGKAFGGPLARQARFALYTSRLPTWHHRLKVGASWFFEGTTARPLLPLGIQQAT